MQIYPLFLINLEDSAFSLQRDRPGLLVSLILYTSLQNFTNAERVVPPKFLKKFASDSWRLCPKIVRSGPRFNGSPLRPEAS